MVRRMAMAPSTTTGRSRARFTPMMATSGALMIGDRKSTRLNSSHSQISYAVFCLKKKNKDQYSPRVDGDPHSYTLFSITLLTAHVETSLRTHYSPAILHPMLPLTIETAVFTRYDH